MTARITITDDSFEHIRGQAVGMIGVEVEDQQHAGAKFVLMTVEGYQQLRQLAYDDSEWKPEEMLAAAAGALVDPNEWDGEGMSAYDDLDDVNTSP